VLASSVARTSEKSGPRRSVAVAELGGAKGDAEVHGKPFVEKSPVKAELWDLG